MGKILTLLIPLAIGLAAGAWWANGGPPWRAACPCVEGECPAVALFSVQELREYLRDARGKPEPLVRVAEGVDHELLGLLPEWHTYAPELRVRCYTPDGYVELGVSGSKDGEAKEGPEDRRLLASTRSSGSPVNYMLWYRVRAASSRE